MNDIRADTINAHKQTVEELYNLDAETQAHQLRISNFLLTYPELTGISYASADLIIAEKNIKIQKAAIKRVAAEIQRRSNVDAVGFRFTYRKVTENQVRRVLHVERLKENPNVKVRKPQNAEIVLKCPHCKKNISYKKTVRNEILAFRTTEVVDDALTQLSEKCNISKSLLVSELLKVGRRYGKEISVSP
jgi:hypothetical protein